MSKHYPSLRRFKGFGVSSMEEIPIALSNGTCDLYIESKESWDFNNKLWGNCESMWLGDFLFSNKVAWPVAVAFSEPINYWLGRSLESRSLDNARQNFLPPSQCIGLVKNNGADKSTEHLGVKSMPDPLIFLRIGIAFAIFYKCVKSSKTYQNRESYQRSKGRYMLNRTSKFYEYGKESFVND